MTKGYTVGVGRAYNASDGSPSPDYTCGHNHRTAAAAQKCLDRLYGSRTVRGRWVANARWHDAYVIGPDGQRVEMF